MENVAEEGFEEATIITEALSDIRLNTEYIIDLLQEDDGEEEEVDS
jgi:hypothetical protein